MKDRDFVAAAQAWSRHATPAMRLRGMRFLGALAGDPDAALCAQSERARIQHEREFEESQLAGANLARLGREPA